MEARQQSGPLDPPPIHCPPQIKGLSAAHDHLLTELTGLEADRFPSRKNPPRPQRASLDLLENAFKGHWEPTLAVC